MIYIDLAVLIYKKYRVEMLMKILSEGKELKHNYKIHMLNKIKIKEAIVI
jgi:hypothetical protein